jgi:amino acid adenylation domain-containing protein
LSRWSGQDDIAVGSPIAGRTHRKTEGLIGFFLNTLVMRTDLSGDPTFVELLGRVKSVALGAYTHQDLPFEKLVAELQPERDLSRQALFQVMFILQNMPLSSLRLPGLTSKLMLTIATTSKFDLTIEFVERESGLEGSVEYATDLFDRETIERFAGNFKTLLEAVVAEADRPISELPLLSEAERRLLLEEWNETSRDYPKQKLIHHLFEEQVERTPEAVAVVYEDQQLTYRELDRRANQLAHYLLTLGVGPESRVGICMERSLEMTVGLLGILKAGGAYLPLDPAYPAERLRLMLDDSDARVLIAQRRIADRLPEVSLPGVYLDSDWETIEQYPATAPPTVTASANLAHIIYTSGSTGRPKAVAAIHSAVVNRLEAEREISGVTAQDVCCQKTSIGFVDAVAETWGPLLNGRLLVVASESEARNPRELLSLIGRERITRLVTVPSLAWSMVESPGAGEELKSLRSWTLSGEALSGDLLRRLRQSLPECRFINLYGSSEVAADATCYADADGAERVTAPIGRPIANTKSYALDRSLEPVPLGVIGELYIGGEGLARGYLGQGGLTAERFVANPYGVDGSRLYRTGDRVRYLADGNLEFIGRADDQVKVRGVRIELGEIEATLLEHPGVRRAVVAAQEQDSGEKQLVAYCVAVEGRTPGAEELRHYLMKTLPQSMIPAAFVFLAELPLNANGKVDRKALPAPDLGAQLEQYVAPRTPTEEVLAQIWAEVLGVERVGVEDNFFVLGGHSLLATQVVARVRESFGVEVPVRALFEASVTVRELGEQVERARREQQGLQAPPLAPRPRQGLLPLSLAQERLWFLEQLESLGSAYNEIMGLELDGALDQEALERSFAELVRRHESLRTRIETTGDGQGRQVIDPAGGFRMVVVDLSTWPEAGRRAEAARQAQAETARPFDLSREMFRVRLFRLSAEEHILLVMLHHIISDVWSLLGILRRELSVLYAAYQEGRSSPLPELEVQYADYALWQREWLQGEILERQVAYWRERLRGIPAALELPTDRPRPAKFSHKGARHPLALSGELTARLEALGRREGATLYMVLLAALQVLLSRWSGQDDIAVGSPIAGRTHRKTEGLIGFFINTLVMRTDLSGDPTFVELLGRVKSVALGAYTHQDLPFEKLVAELQPERDLSRQALVQVMFILQNMPLSSSGLPGLTWRQAPLAATTSKFDLTIEFVERDSGLEGSVEYATDLFDRETIERFAGNFKTLLEAVVAEADRPISELPLLSEAERRLLLEEWNETEAKYPSHVCVHELFEEQVWKTPDAAAVISEDAWLSYGGLNRRANQLAHYLRELGARPETRVGICLNRSIRMVEASLGVLKAGAAYVPLDPASPPDRLMYMLEDARLIALISEKEVIKGLQGYSGRIISIDADREIIAEERVENPSSGAMAENLAYIIYTSGSTGQPKGVGIEHKGLVNLVTWHQSEFSVSSQDRATQVSAIGFDASVWEVWPYLTAGASIYIAPEDARRNHSELLSWLEKNEITIGFLSTPLAEAVLTEEWPASVRMRELLTGGDRLHRASVEGKRISVINNYGPTESTVVATSGRVEEGGGEPSIGRPIQNTKIYILDEKLRPTPVGVCGELYISGAGLARGYQDRPGLTAERFIADGFRAAGKRMYRTGDLGRWRADGTIEFLGRNDSQVKIRGYRIELGEIEARLAEHAGVGQAVVIAHDDNETEKRLVAYYTGEEAGSESLCAHLSSTLPEYMLPAAFVFLPELPLTPNGKLDRKALPAPDQSKQLERQYEGPRTPMERILCAIWEQILGVERAGIRDNFFELGGHSLMMMRVHHKIQQELAKKFPLMAMFEHSTIASLAKYLINSNPESHSYEEANLRATEQRERRRRQREQRKLRLSSP